jgi:hypothetical protein
VKKLANAAEVDFFEALTSTADDFGAVLPVFGAAAFEAGFGAAWTRLFFFVAEVTLEDPLAVAFGAAFFAAFGCAFGCAFGAADFLPDFFAVATFLTDLTDLTDFAADLRFGAFAIN